LGNRTYRPENRCDWETAPAVRKIGQFSMIRILILSKNNIKDADRDRLRRS
jgi:hypothetical protein